MTKPTVAPQQLIESIQKNVAAFSNWDENYLWTGVYDLQDRNVKRDLESWGYDYENG